MRSMVHIEWRPIASHFFAKFTTFSGLVNGAGLTKAEADICHVFVLLLIITDAEIVRLKIDQPFAPFQGSMSEIYTGQHDN